MVPSRGDAFHLLKKKKKKTLLRLSSFGTKLCGWLQGCAESSNWLWMLDFPHVVLKGHHQDGTALQWAGVHGYIFFLVLPYLKWKIYVWNILPPGIIKLNSQLSRLTAPNSTCDSVMPRSLKQGRDIIIRLRVERPWGGKKVHTSFCLANMFPVILSKGFRNVTRINPKKLTQADIH